MSPDDTLKKYIYCPSLSSQITTISNLMFVRMLAVHCDQNDSYEITMYGYQAKKINGNNKRNFRS